MSRLASILCSHRRRCLFHSVPTHCFSLGFATWLVVLRRGPVDVKRRFYCNPVFEVLVSTVHLFFSILCWNSGGSCSSLPHYVQLWRTNNAASTTSTTSRQSIYSTYAATLFHLLVLSSSSRTPLKSRWHATPASAQHHPAPFRCLLLIASTTATSPLTKPYSCRVLLCLSLCALRVATCAGCAGKRSVLPVCPCHPSYVHTMLI